MSQNRTREAIACIESNDFIKAHDLLEKSLYVRAGKFLEEKKKQVVASTWKKTITESDAKSNLNASRRKAFREKMQKQKAVK